MRNAQASNASNSRASVRPDSGTASERAQRAKLSHRAASVSSAATSRPSDSADQSASLTAQPAPARAKRSALASWWFSAARAKLREAGAHEVLDGIDEVSELLARLNARLGRGEKP